MKIEEFIDYFDEIEDPRVDRCKKHSLIDIVVITVIAFICGAQCWEEVEDFGEANKDWFKEFLELPNDIPSKDTYARLIARLNPEEFQSCLLSCLQGISKKSKDEIIAVDGKTLRRSHDRKNHQHPLHLVSAWAANSRVTLGEVKTEGKGNELSGIEKILDIIDIKDTTVTIDALGCQKKIVQKIAEKSGNYILAVKANQGTLHSKMINLFKKAKELDYKAMCFKDEKTIDGDHGRIETRQYTVLPLMYAFEFKKHWKNISAFIKVEGIREVGDRTKIESRYYISSLNPREIKKISDGIRKHWSIENSLHWCLDVALNEDQCRIRKGNAPENLAILRRFILSLLKSETTFKGGIRRKQRKALMDKEYLNLLLSKI